MRCIPLFVALIAMAAPTAVAGPDVWVGYGCYEYHLLGPDKHCFSEAEQDRGLRGGVDAIVFSVCFDTSSPRPLAANQGCAQSFLCTIVHAVVVCAEEGDEGGGGAVAA